MVILGYGAGASGIVTPWIYNLNATVGGEARKHLRRKGKPYRSKTRQDGRGHLKDTVSIEHRPKEVEQRLCVGDWEIDTVLGKPGTGGLVTVVDRKTRLLLAAKIEDKTAAAVQAALIRLIKGVECRSLTTDNGKEFARHKKVSAALGVGCVLRSSSQPLGAWYK